MHAGKSIKILIIDDDKDDFLLISDSLKNIANRLFEIEWMPSYQKGLDRVLALEHDVYIIDYYLGAYTGLHLIREAIKANCEAPMILLTGVNNPEVDASAAEMGAFDYLVKGDLNSDRLERSIRYSMAQAAMIRAVRENEAKFRSVFEKSHDMIFIATPSGKLTRVSNSAQSLTGYTVEELLGMNTSQLYADPEEGAEIERKLVETGEVESRRIDILTKNGDKRICTLHASMQSDQYGRQYCQGVLHDLTAKVKEERAILLSEKMEATGRLMRMLAHEVRNPLTNINLAVDGIGSETDDQSELAVYVDIIKRNTRRIDNLVTQLLNAAKPTRLKQEPGSLGKLLKETLEETQDRLLLKKIQVRLHLNTEPDCALVDAEKIKIAFTNIIVNAIEAMPEENGILSVALKKTNQKLVVSISDNGSGINPELLGRLFEPYFTSKPGGMGLGLASTLNIVQSHNASIDVESQPNKGTTFYLTFNAANCMEK